MFITIIPSNDILYFALSKSYLLTNPLFELIDFILELDLNRYFWWFEGLSLLVIAKYSMKILLIYL